LSDAAGDLSTRPGRPEMNWLTESHDPRIPRAPPRSTRATARPRGTLRRSSRINRGSSSCGQHDGQCHRDHDHPSRHISQATPHHCGNHQQPPRPGGRLRTKGSPRRRPTWVSLTRPLSTSPAKTPCTGYPDSLWPTTRVWFRPRGDHRQAGEVLGAALGGARRRSDRARRGGHPRLGPVGNGMDEPAVGEPVVGARGDRGGDGL